MRFNGGIVMRSKSMNIVYEFQPMLYVVLWLLQCL